MLVQLHIENYALIDRAVIEFGPGLNVLTGETGAGKSLLVGALGLALGQRASTEVVRNENAPTVVEALFDIAPYPHLATVLEPLGIDLQEMTLLLKRVLTRNGSRCYINAHLATVAMLQQVSRGLVDIVGQHQQQTLVQAEQQLALLDSFAQLTAERAALQRTYTHYQRLKQQYVQVRREEQRQRQRQELVQAQGQEIDQAALQIDEEERLAQEQHLLQHAERLHALAQTVYTALYRHDTSLLAQLAMQIDTLTQLEALDPRQGHVREELQESYYLVEGVAQHLRDYAQRLESDPVRLQSIEDRLAEISRLQRKYGPNIAAILQHRDSLRREQQTWRQQGEQLKVLAAQLGQARQQLSAQASALSDKRRSAAVQLQHAVEQELRELNMASTVFQVVLTRRQQAQGEFVIDGARLGLTPEGIDEVEYRFAPNLGEPPRALARIASGGELSRLMLAVRGILARVDAVPTIIFDEVDTGIGGRTAKIVGEKLSRLARAQQIFCITHLPQIASHGDRHYRITKSVQQQRTITRIDTLDFAARVEEVARMSGGKTITETTRRHAEEMLLRRP